MDKEYSIDEILSAVNDFHVKIKDKTPQKLEMKYNEIENSGIPKNTLKLIEQAEKKDN